MKSGLKKSLYLGLAAVSFVAAAGAASTTASAKTYAKIASGSNVALTSDATTRNVTLTGSNALYTKAGTLKGAKVVATTTTAKKLNSSTSGKANFRAYRVAKTTRGSVYYKVVSFDGSYRGWIYGGKSTSDFGGGIASYATTKTATAPASDATYKLSAATSDTANTLFFKEPSYTQYKVGRAKVNGTVLALTSAYKDSTFTFGAAKTTSREGDTYYQVASVDGSTTNGLVGAWVKASNVSQTNAEPTATSANSVTVVYRDSNRNVISTATKKFIAKSGTSTAEGQKVSGDTNTAGQTLTQFGEANLPSGYTATDETDAANATYGGSYYVTIAKAATSKASFYYINSGSAASTAATLAKTAFSTGAYPSLTTAVQTKTFTGTDGSTFDFANLATAFTGTTDGGYYGTSSSTGKVYFYKYDADATKANNASTAKYGDTIKVVFDRTEVAAPTNTTTTDSGNSNYAE
ncbi:hypothetical protein [Secundilactobacillus similis]|uniref:S-layer protein n=1 Tax=Secundilactobacillus similis DSM 23365 = JCM 2765 TaxID=1423804 RepID=A0A0R2F110_9LACO|nr:hypothetical protein [Secundilactobacillus similis]KRN21147.1 S-layer protein [Secundilactobacillus similis DSM 23365 = JCM 2765]